MAETQDILDYYVDLLIIQYNNKPKARATIELISQTLLANGIFFDVQNGYDIETAIGVQLDVLGKYADIDRFYQGQTFEDIFSFILYDEVDAPPVDRVGFTDYTDFETKEGEWLNYAKTLSNDLTLNDDDFRSLLKLRIIQNNTNHSHQAIDQAIFDTFGSDIIPDSDGNMIMDYFILQNDIALIEAAQSKQALPRPLGVQLRYFIEKKSAFFGFSTYDNLEVENIAGFATYADYDTKEGETLRYLKLTEA